MAHVLVVEDDDNLARSWRRVLVREGHTVCCTGTVAGARRVLQEAGSNVEAVLLDLHLPDGNGQELLKEISSMDRPVAVAVVSGHVDATSALDLHGKVSLVLPKPLRPGHLTAALRVLTGPGREPLVQAYAKEMGLSPQETEVLSAITRGREMHEVALDVGCTEGTVKTYLQRIFSKTKIRSQREVLAALVRFAGSQDPG